MLAILTVLSYLAAAETPAAPSTQITVDGLVRLIEHIDVPSRSEGRLQSVSVKEGSRVQRGDVLAKLDDEEAQLTLQRARTEQQSATEKAKSETTVEIARLTRDFSHAEFERAQNARKSSPGSISPREFDRLKFEADKSDLELVRLNEERRLAFFVSQTKSLDVDLARLALEQRQIISPLDGIVVQVHRREGEWVRPGEKTIRVVRIDRLRVEAFVNLSQNLAALESAPVVLQVAGKAGQAYSGTVVFVHPEADPVNGQVRLWAEIENRDGALRPGQRGRLTVTLPGAESAEALPLALPPGGSKLR